MKARTKEIIRDGFGSLVSNASAMRGAKAGPFWLTLLMFIFGILLPIIPQLVGQLNTNGSTFLNSYSYGLEKNVTVLASDLKNERNVEFSIDSDHLLTVTEGGNVVDYANYGYLYAYGCKVNERTKQYDLLLYISDATIESDKYTVVDLINQKRFAANTLDETISPDTVEGIYRPSYIVLFKNGIYVSLFSSTDGITQVAYSYSGDFKTIEPNDHCLETLLTVDGVDKNIYEAAYCKGVFNNFKKVLDRSYETLKIQNTLVSCSIYLGIYFGMSFLMGLIMFLLTRGKKNPNNYFSLWLCLKIQARLGFCPGLITMIAGFFLISQSPIIYVMTLGLRVMWISMKELRPVQA